MGSGGAAPETEMSVDHALVRGEVLWTPPDDCWETTAFGRFAARCGFDRDADGLLAWSRTHLDDFWAASCEFTGVRWMRPPDAVREGDTMPGVRWFPGADAQLRRPGAGARVRDARRDRGRGREPDARPHRAHVGRAARRRAPLRRRPASPRRRPRHARRGVCPEHPRDARRLPRRRVARRGVVELRAGVRRALRHRPLPPDRAARVVGRRRVPLRRQGHRPHRPWA